MERFKIGMDWVETALIYWFISVLLAGGVAATVGIYKAAWSAVTGGC
jgi:Flp pilus assembly pilin Flp